VERGAEVTANTQREPRRLCTIAARNYAPSVRLLVDTFAEHHAGVPITVLFVDKRPDDSFRDFPCEVVGPEALPMRRDMFLRMATYYDVTELSTALKPYLLQHLLDVGSETVMYLDPDIEVFAGLDDLFDAAADHDIVLTPHVLHPMPRDGLNISEETIMASGQFNLGFITVSQAARPFLEYWSDRTRLHALSDQARGYFTDQRWVDVVPQFWRYLAWRDPGCNVAYWNLHERDLAVNGADQWTVDGAPLRFFHYSGHDARNPTRLSRFVVPPERVQVDSNPALRRLLVERAARIRALEPAGGPPPYGWKRTAAGMELTSLIRRTYWEAVSEAETQRTSLPPHAFGADGGRRFVDWLLEPATPEAGISRFLFALWQDNPHYQRLFPDPLREDAARLTDSARIDVTLTMHRLTPIQLRPSLPALPGGLPGINLVHDGSKDDGRSATIDAVRRMTRGAGLPLVESAIGPQRDGGDDAPLELSLIALDADDLVAFAASPGWNAHRDRKRVAVVTTASGAHKPEAYQLVDEIWCPSEHVRMGLDLVAAPSVLVHPLVVEIPQRAPRLTRADLGLPEDVFLFTTAFDLCTSMAAANVLGTINTYRRTFAPGEAAALVVLLSRARYAPDGLAIIEAATTGRPDITLITRSLDPVESAAYAHHADCFISLHRSVDLGLPLAHAMAAGTPAIATGWSGNLEFMDTGDSVLVPYALVDAGGEAGPHAGMSQWAEPDVDAAAEAMRSLFDDHARATHLGRLAQAAIRARCSTAPAVRWLMTRFEDLTSMRISDAA
jgi:hypothetical protein